MRCDSFWAMPLAILHCKICVHCLMSMSFRLMTVAFMSGLCLMNASPKVNAVSGVLLSKQSPIGVKARCAERLLWLVAVTIKCDWFGDSSRVE